MKLSKIALIVCLLPASAFAEKNNCRLVVDASTVKVSWTAFKTTEKTPVTGTLKELSVKTPAHGAKTLKALLAETKASGQIDQETKSDSGNPARDTTLFQKFFSLISSKGKFAGTFKHMKGDDKTGDFDLSLELNGKSHSVPMKYTLNPEGAFEANGEFDMLQFGLESQLASLHQACEVLHKGKDGVSKTWPNVGIKLAAKINQDCSKK